VAGYQAKAFAGDELMKYILRKYVEAANAKEALALDRKTPVHALYLKDGEEPKDRIVTNAIGFQWVKPEDDEK